MEIQLPSLWYIDTLLVSLLVLSFFANTSISSLDHQEHSSSASSMFNCLIKGSLPYNVVFTPENPNYTPLFFSSVHNNRTLSSSPKPLLIITPTQEFHVSVAVLCSRELKIQLITRSGGHDFEGLSYTTTSPFFVLVELHEFRSIAIDLIRRTAWVEAGATLGEMYYAFAAESNNTLAFPAGVYSTVGVGGHFSGGGMGMMMRAYGLAVDNVMDAKIVTANGEILDRESMGEDLFWAIRGGGGASFGVILSYKLNLVQVPPKVTVFYVDRILQQGLIQLLTKWNQIAPKLDKRLFMRLNLQAVSDKSGSGGANKTVNAKFESLFLGEVTELLPLIAESFPEFGLEAKDCMEVSWIRAVLYNAGYPSPDVPLNKLLDRTPQSNKLFKTMSDIQRDVFSEEVWEAIVARLLREDELPILIFDPFGGRMDEIDEAHTPFPHRKGSLYLVEYILKWDDPGLEAAKKHMNWLRNFYKFMEPYVSHNPRAAYLNYRDLDLGINVHGNASYLDARVWGEKYFKGNFRRLAIVKSSVDPDNLFWNVQSIPVLA
ncbi:Cannabidiolic acid synthase [Platanthera guangdongensis]|uniref:Cannabidiolic acid synthase n=1 Tax=Platanthera guangdongensis TaxID=2320717 RepID=A0ABR2MX34_9ASPA